VLLNWRTRDPIVFWLGCCCDHVMCKENGRFPVTYFKTDTYITFLNKQNLPYVHMTVENATRLKREQASSILFKSKAGLFSIRQGQ
jgi:hypothetical protein